MKVTLRDHNEDGNSNDSNDENTGGGGNDADMDNKANDKVLSDLIKSARGSKLMLKIMKNILEYDKEEEEEEMEVEVENDENQKLIIMIMKKAILQLIKAVKDVKKEGTKAKLRKDMKQYDKDIAAAIKKIYPKYEHLVNLGDDVYMDNEKVGDKGFYSILALFNYATLKEVTRAFSDDSKHNFRLRGEKSKMDPLQSECLRMALQSMPRAYINAVREQLGIEYEPSNVFASSIAMLDPKCICFDPDDKSEAAYNEAVNTVAENILLSEEMLDAIMYIKFLHFVLDHELDQVESDVDKLIPLPVLVLSRYTYKNWFDLTTEYGVVLRVKIDGSMWHPEFVLRGFTNGCSPAEMENKNEVCAKFFSMAPEVLKVLSNIPLVKQAVKESDHPDLLTFNDDRAFG